MARDASARRVRPTFVPSPAGADGAHGVLVLADGSRAELLTAEPAILARFLDGLAPNERREVARSFGLDLATSVEALVDQIVARDGDSRYVARRGDELLGIAAFRSELDAAGSARLGFAVAPSARRLGLGTLLLERLMVSAARAGVDRLIGVAGRDHQTLAALFRHGGFAPDTETDDGATRFVFATRAPLGADPAESAASAHGAASLRPLLHPRSIAVVGASRDPSSVGFRILDALITGRFHGPVFPVNPKADFVGSVRAYPSLTAIDHPIDLVVVAVPARLVSAVVDEAIAVGAGALVVITAGFAEVGDGGRAAQNELARRVREAGLRMVGPNCLGVIHTHPDVRMNASFAPLLPRHGGVSLCSQSGALGIAIIALARRLGLGLSSFVSVGNKADVSGNDLLEYWQDDPATRVALFYLESVGEPRRFARLARRFARSKPIVVVKAGRTGAGRRAASSHTAALVASDSAVDALFHQNGIIRAETLEEMFSLARALLDQPLPPGRRVAIVTNAGGPAILCSDALEAKGLRVEPLADATQAALLDFLPPEASRINPVDMIASATPEAFERSVAEVLSADEVDALVVIYTPTGIYPVADVMAAVGRGIETARAAGAVGKPVLASLIGEEGETVRFETAGGETVPVYAFPEEIARVLGKLAPYAAWRAADLGDVVVPGGQDLERARAICRAALKRHGDGWLSIEDAVAVLAAAGLSFSGGFAGDRAAACQLAAEVGFPVAVKLASRRIVHKTEHGGVVLDLADAEAVGAAWDAIAARLAAAGEEDAMDGVVVQPMVDGGVEVMLGVEQDPLFGPLLAFGLGGIHVEILRDVTFRVAPLSDRDAHEMVRALRGRRLLEGYRGHPAGDLE
ncbi:MAG: GNAT family N-acetyltransferase, partial [Acidobacteriota bacterium]